MASCSTSPPFPQISRAQYTLFARPVDEALPPTPSSLTSVHGARKKRVFRPAISGKGGEVEHGAIDVQLPDRCRCGQQIRSSGCERYAPNRASHRRPWRGGTRDGGRTVVQRVAIDRDGRDGFVRRARDDHARLAGTARTGAFTASDHAARVGGWQAAGVDRGAPRIGGRRPGIRGRRGRQRRERTEIVRGRRNFHRRRVVVDGRQERDQGSDRIGAVGIREKVGLQRLIVCRKTGSRTSSSVRALPAWK